MIGARRSRSLGFGAIATAFTLLTVGISNVNAATGGPEHQANVITANEQGYPAVAPRGSGFVVVWESYGRDGSGNSVAGRRLDAHGIPVGTEFQINTYTTGAQDSAAVASDNTGNFVVVWESFGQDGSTDGIFGRRYAANGVPLGDEFQINTSTVNAQDDPRIATSFAGNFVVTWEAFNQDNSAATIVFQRYSSAGTKLGGETIVNSYTTGGQVDPDIAMDAFGRFVIVWTSANQDGSRSGVFGQRFSSSGIPQGTEFRVNTFTTGTQDEPSVASDFAGNFIVAWESNGQDGSANGVFAQRYNAVGATLGAEFRANTVTLYSQDDVTVATDSFGGFIVSWESIAQDGDPSNGVFHRPYDASGVPLSAEVQTNVTVANSQDDVAIAIAAAGHYATAWNSFGQDGDLGTIIDRQYSEDIVTTTTVTTTTTTLSTPPTTTIPLGSMCAPSPHFSCKLADAGRSKVVLHDRAGTKDDLIWKLSRGEATTMNDFLDPPANGNARYRLCIYDSSGAQQPLIEAAIPPGPLCGSAQCWSDIAGGYKYKDKFGTSGGVTLAKLKSGTAGKARVLVKAKGVNLMLPDLPLSFPLTIQLVASDSASETCWQTRFTVPILNEEKVLKAKGP